MRFVFLGTPAFAVPSLRRLIDLGADLLIVTQPDRAAGRGKRVISSAVKELAMENGLNVIQPRNVNDDESLASIADFQPDALVVAAFGQILKQPLLNIPRRGSLNVHASLLPKYRGASPVAAAIIAGEQTTGVTIMEVELRLDAGPIVAQKALPIDATDTTGTLTEKIAELGAGLLVEQLQPWLDGSLASQPQNDALATYAKPLRKQDAAIDWTMPAEEIWRRVRAYNPWPVATASLSGAVLRILEAAPVDLDTGTPPGSVVEAAHGAASCQGIAVQCGSGALCILRAQREGKRVVSGAELVRGWRELAGGRFD